MFGLKNEELCSGLFSDVMDTLGYSNQVITGFLRNHNGISVLGRARTLVLKSVKTDDENIRKGLSFIGDIEEGEILLVKGSMEFAYFGELMTKLSTRQKIQGVVIDGLTRDTNYTHKKEVELPILARGYSPVDIKGRGRVEEVDQTIEIDGKKVEPNTLVYIDNEAICIIPQEIEEEVIFRVKEKLVEEKRITKLIKKDITIEELLKTVKEF